MKQGGVTQPCDRIFMDTYIKMRVAVRMREHGIKGHRARKFMKDDQAFLPVSEEGGWDG